MLTIKLAMRSLWRHRMRTIFTLCAIGLGHMFFLIFMTMSDGGLADMVELAIKQGSAGHVVVQAKGYQKARSVELLVPDGARIRQTIQAKLPKAAVVLRTFGGGLARSSSESVGVFFSGVEPRLEREVSHLSKVIKRGVYLGADEAAIRRAEKKPGALWCARPPKKDAPQAHPIIVGEQLARTLRLNLCEKLVLDVQGMGDRESGEFRVVGIFRTGSADVDTSFVQIPLPDAQRLLHIGDSVHQVAVLLASADESHAAASVIKKAVGRRDALEILPWDEAIPEMADFVWFKKVSGYFFIAIVIFIVGIGVLNTVFMSVMERSREIGVMRALGTRPGQVLRLVLAEGAVIGAIGVVVGIALALPLVHYLETTGIRYQKPMEAAGVVVESFKGKLYLSSLVGGSLAVFFITLVSAIPPAIRAARIHVLRAIQQN
ncbi:MAG: FtsX-like permease family protein [bacterium]